MSGTQQQERFHFLDGIRGIAASMIVVHHAFSSNIAAFFVRMHLPLVGYFLQTITGSGVNLFFVLSGIVLLRPYLRRQRKLKVWDYFKRRIKRIYPPYFFALLFAAFVAWVNTAHRTWYNDLGMHVDFTWTETLKEAGIVSFNETYYNLAWWSLQIEILFYVLAPLIILAFPDQNKLNNRRISITIMATLAATLGLQFLFTFFWPHLYSVNAIAQTFWRFVDYPICFLVGVLLAARDFSNRAAQVLIATGVVIIGVSAYYFPIVHAGYGLLYGGLIILAFNLQSWRYALSKPLMIWLGERSYSLFLVHSSVFYLVNNIVSRYTNGRDTMYGVLTRGIGIPLALFAAMLLFWFVERRQARGLVTGNIFWPWQVKRLKEHKPAVKEMLVNSRSN